MNFQFHETVEATTAYQYNWMSDNSRQRNTRQFMASEVPQKKIM